MSEITKKKKPIQELIQERSLEELIQESRQLADADERELLIIRKKMAERDLSVEKFLSKEKGALKRYNQRRQMHIDIEKMPEKEIISETIEIVE